MRRLFSLDEIPSTTEFLYLKGRIQPAMACILKRNDGIVKDQFYSIYKFDSGAWRPTRKDVADLDYCFRQWEISTITKEEMFVEIL